MRPICLPFPYPPPSLISLLPCRELCRTEEWPMEISLPRWGAKPREMLQDACLSNAGDKYLPSLDALQVVSHSEFYYILYFRKNSHCSWAGANTTDNWSPCSLATSALATDWYRKALLVVAAVLGYCALPVGPREMLPCWHHTSYSSIGTSGPCLTFNFHTIRVKQYMYISR